MKFEGKGIIWDAEGNRVLARFDKEGGFETSDERVIEKLIGMGFKSDMPIVPIEDKVEKVEEKVAEKPKRSPRKKKGVE